jgi:hypothetical protein
MTLCIAWRASDGTIHLAADSRISIRDVFMDVAIKVSSLPYEVRGATNMQTGRAPIVQSGKLGICCAGSTVSMFAIKETISELLLNLCTAGDVPVSLRGIAEIVFAAYRQIQPQVTNALAGPAGIVNLFLAGYCPKSACYKAFLIKTDKNTNNSSLSEILNSTSVGYELLGQKMVAQRRLELADVRKTETYLRALQASIDDPALPGVGGAAMYGFTLKDKFPVWGVVNSSSGNGGFRRGGLDYSASEFMLKNSDFLSVHCPVLDIAFPGCGERG